MSDLVERLRARDAELGTAYADDKTLLREAADEIVRLRASAKGQLAVVNQAIAERDEMRSALESCQRVLADLTGGDKSLSTMHLWASAVEAEVKARAAIRARGT